METTVMSRAYAPNDSQRALEADAALAHETLRRQVALAGQYASTHAHTLGDAATSRYREALQLGAQAEPSGAAWQRFVGAVWAFVCELDRSTVDRSVSSRAARGALDRIVVENVDLLS